MSCVGSWGNMSIFFSSRRNNWLYNRTPTQFINVINFYKSSHLLLFYCLSLFFDRSLLLSFLSHVYIVYAITLSLLSFLVLFTNLTAQQKKKKLWIFFAWFTFIFFEIIQAWLRFGDYQSMSYMDEGLMESNICHILAIEIIHNKQYNLSSSVLKLINLYLSHRQIKFISWDD